MTGSREDASRGAAVEAGGGGMLVQFKGEEQPRSSQNARLVIA